MQNQEKIQAKLFDHYAPGFSQEETLKNLFSFYFKLKEQTKDNDLSRETIKEFGVTHRNRLSDVIEFLKSNNFERIFESVISETIEEKNRNLMAAVKFEKEDLEKGKQKSKF